MTHEEQRVWLIQYLLAEKEEYRNYGIPQEEQEQKNLLRGLLNVRMPGPVSEEFLKIQDAYLQAENAQNGIVEIEALAPVKSDHRLYLWQGDITHLAADAIVNAANSQMLGCFVPMHNCIDNCIHTFAGVQLRAECSRRMHQLRKQYGMAYEQPTAVPMLTDGFNLPAKKVVHIVGPIVTGALTPSLEQDLADCYSRTLAMCAENGLESVAFCCISTGVFMFPNQKAAEIAVGTVRNWLDETGSDMKVIFNVYKDLDLEIYQKLLSDD